MVSKEEEFSQQVFRAAENVAKCPHIQRCSSEFRHVKAGNNPLYFADTPSPDYIGPRYRGLLVIGGNPGVAHQLIHDENDAITFQLQRRIANGDQNAFKELMAHLPRSMEHWPQMVNQDGRNRMQYDIEEIAYIEIVKCGTKPGHGNTAKLFRGTGILKRCWEAHTKALLDVLRPTHIVGLWVPIRSVIAQLGYEFDGVFGHHSGARNLTLESRYANARLVFDHYYNR